MGKVYIIANEYGDVFQPYSAYATKKGALNKLLRMKKQGYKIASNRTGPDAWGYREI